MATRKILMIMTDDARSWEISLGQLFPMVRSGLAETLVFGEADADGLVKWEKRFRVVEVVADPAQEQFESGRCGSGPACAP